MKSYITLLEEIVDVDKKILDLWASNADIETIKNTTKRKVGYIKQVLRINKRKGWEEL